MAILLVILTIALVVSIDFKKVKTTVDNDAHAKPFDPKRDWWLKRYDNMVPMIISGLIGGILSRELGAPLIEWVAINQFAFSKEDLVENIAIESLELFSVFLVTYVFIRFFNKKE